MIDFNSCIRIDGLAKHISDLAFQSRADRNWAMSDKIRDRLAGLGIEIKDAIDCSSFTFS